MKFNYKIIVAGVLSASSLTSCYDLDLYPHDEVSTGVFWKTEEHAKQAMMGVYDCMKAKADAPGVAKFGDIYLMDALTDMAGANPLVALQNGTSNNRTATYKNKWSNMYDGIAKANHMLQNLPNIEMSEEKLQEFQAEARFMRAFFYFHLLDFYGGVPIYDESWILSEVYDQMKEPRSTAEQVAEFIRKDLDFAEERLPYSWDAANYGRATKAAAVALRGKMHLYMKQYDTAKKDFEKLVNNKSQYGCDLHPDYAEMFKPDTDENKEMIFFISNSGGVGDANDGLSMAFYHGSRSTFGSGWSTSTLLPDFVDAYEMKDGKKFNWDDYIPGYTKMTPAQRRQAMGCKQKNGKVTEYPELLAEIEEAYENRDPRLKQTIIAPYDSILGWLNNKEHWMQHVIFADATGPTATNGYVQQGTSRWYHLRKFVPEGDWGGQIMSRENTPVNFPLIRYADVLLMLAECHNELGNIDEAVKYINMVRARPSTNMPGLNSGPQWLEARTKDEVFKRIVHERGVEFAVEGLRYSDLRRWRLAETYCTFQKTDMHGAKRHDVKFTERDYLWPIPGTEIEMNDKLTQNPGWE